CGTIDRQALMHLLDPLTSLSLLCQRPAAHHSPDHHPERKSLVCGERDSGFCTFLGSTSLAAKLMEPGSTAQGISQAKGMGTLLPKGHRFVVPRQPLSRIAKIPQRPGGKAVTHYTSVLPIEQCRGTVLLGIVERYTLRKVCVRIGCRAQVEQRRP